MTFSTPDVCVIIAAKNAADTIARAIRSALEEPRVAELIVVDDGSSDTTAQTSRAADDGSGRLRVVTFATNKGPAVARNHAIANSKSPLIAILDADDFFLKGRFDRLLEGDDWDFVADNIVFINAGSNPGEPHVPEFAADPSFLDLDGFIEGNISRRGASRGEIGFLKPVMRRAFLDRHGLRYREDMRLGEDYDLYARALIGGARYKIVHGCGYGAIVRANSLSGRHSTLDLKRLYEADQAILASPDLPENAARSLRKHERHVRGRYELRHFLDIKTDAGRWKAVLHALSSPTALPAIVGGVVADKIETLRGRNEHTGTDSAGLRFLMAGRTVAQK